MSPAEFAEVVVVSTVREHLDDRGDRRRAYLACIATYSLVDYVGQAMSDLDGARKPLREICLPAYQVVQGICNGTKHAGSTKGKFAFRPGDDTVTPVAAYGYGFYGYGRYGGMAGLQVDHNGTTLFIDGCVQAVLGTLAACHSSYLDSLDLTFFDPQFRPVTPP